MKETVIDCTRCKANNKMNSLDFQAYGSNYQLFECRECKKQIKAFYKINRTTEFDRIENA